MLSGLFYFLFTLQCLLVGLMMLAGPPHCMQAPKAPTTSQDPATAAIAVPQSKATTEDKELDCDDQLNCCALSDVTEPRTNVSMPSEAAQVVA